MESETSKLSDPAAAINQPAETEAEILQEPESRAQAVQKKKDVENSKELQAEKLPKLSAADFRVYNSMADHMEYFVSITTHARRYRC